MAMTKPTSEQVTFLQTGTGATAQTVDAKLKDTVSVKDFGAVGDGVTDDTVAIQAAVTHCIANNKDLLVDGLCLITSSVNIDRLVDSAPADNWFTIGSTSGGGFIVTTAIAMFSSSIAFTTAPVTQLTKFHNLRFESSNNALAAYVLNDARFLRTMFDGCSFRKIKCLVALTVYTQSIYFSNCNMRRWTGSFFRSTYIAIDLRVSGCIMEAGETAFQLDDAIGCCFVNNLIEGMTSHALSIAGCQGLTVCGNYFEANAVDIALNAAATSALGASITGNFFSASAGTWNIFWDNASNCVSLGNYSTLGSGIHNLTSNSKVFINDYSSVAITNTAEYARYAKDTLGVGINVPIGVAHMHSAANSTLALTDNVLGTAYGAAIRGYGVIAQGGYAELGVYNNSVYQWGLKCNYNGQLYTYASLDLGAQLNMYKAATAPTYVKGAIYFDTTLNKLRVGGATAWETITSV